MKPLSELPNNPEHCQLVWTCITGLSSAIERTTKDDYSMRIYGEYNERVTVDYDGRFSHETYGEHYTINAFTIVKLLTELGYEPVP